MKVLASETFSAVSAPIQFAAVSAFKDDHNEYISKSKKILKAIGRYIYNNLKSNNVIMNKPMGGFYLMPEFLNKTFNTSTEMCTDLLNKKCVPCEGGILPFDISEIHKYQKKIDGWIIVKNKKNVYLLEKKFTFKNFLESQK